MKSPNQTVTLRCARWVIERSVFVIQYHTQYKVGKHVVCVDKASLLLNSNCVQRCPNPLLSEVYVKAEWNICCAVVNRGKHKIIFVLRPFCVNTWVLVGTALREVQQRHHNASISQINHMHFYNSISQAHICSCFVWVVPSIFTEVANDKLHKINSGTHGIV